MREPKRVLIVGEEPSMVDFSDPAIPPGMNTEKIRAGLRAAMERLRANGREVDLVLTTSAEAAFAEVKASLQAQSYDCVVVGAGIRIVPKMTGTFEAVMNALHENAPKAGWRSTWGPRTPRTRRSDSWAGRLDLRCAIAVRRAIGSSTVAASRI